MALARESWGLALRDGAALPFNRSGASESAAERPSQPTEEPRKHLPVVAQGCPFHVATVNRLPPTASKPGNQTTGGAP